MTHVTPIPSLMFLVLLAIAVTLYSTFAVKPGRPFRCALYVGGRDYSGEAESVRIKNAGKCEQRMYATNFVKPRGFVLPMAGQRSRTQEPRSSLNMVGKAMLNGRLRGHGHISTSLLQSVSVSPQTVVVIAPRPACSFTLSKPSTCFDPKLILCLFVFGIVFLTYKEK